MDDHGSEPAGVPITHALEQERVIEDYERGRRREEIAEALHVSQELLEALAELSPAWRRELIAMLTVSGVWPMQPSGEEYERENVETLRRIRKALQEFWLWIGPHGVEP